MKSRVLDVDLDETAAFLAALTGGDGWTVPMLFQTYDDRTAKELRMSRILAGSLRRHARELVRLNAAGACIAVTINGLRGVRRLASQVVALRALFIDCDADLAQPLALAPSISVQSKNGPHHYWLLRPGEPVSLFAAAQRQLAAFYGSDPLVSDPSRVMRVPGFLHRKAEPYRVQLLKADASRRFTLAEALRPHECYGAEPSPLPRTRPNASPEAVRAFRAWAASAPRRVGVRNVTAFVMASEGLKTGVPNAILATEVRAYCARAGIDAEADAVLRSAHRRHRR